ncbi:MAG: putative rane protein [Candidatus Eremiobacteraeota bacterium]|nr:putative rane protein [Candidatus Eremiobacteraeota bacterium]
MISKPGKTIRLALLALVVVISWGVALRVWHLDRQVVFDDEVWTAIRVAGISERELASSFDDREHAVASWRERFFTASARGAPAIVQTLAHDEPQWPPLHFVLTWWWERIVGSSPLAARVLAAVFGILAIPAVAWLARELFGSNLAAAIAAGLFAVSPVAVAYAREARGYSLLMLAIAASSAALLRASRTRVPRDWAIYAVALLAGLYDYTLFAIVAAGHAVWTFLDRRNARPAVRSYLLAALPVLALWSPWLLVALTHRGQIEARLPTTAGHDFATFVLPKWLYNVCLPFFALDFWVVRLGWLTLPIAAIVAGAIGVLWRTAEGRRALLFLASISLPTAGVLMVVDLRWHLSLVLLARYEMPLLIALEVAVAGALAQALARDQTRRVRRFAALAAGGLLLATSASSSAWVAGAPYWWDTWYDASVFPVIAAINARERPLLVAEEQTFPEVVFANGLRDDARLLLLRSDPNGRCRHTVIDAAGSSAFLLARPASLRHQPRLQGDVRLKPVFVSDGRAGLAWRYEQLLHGHVPRGETSRWAAFELFRIEQRATTQTRLQRLVVCR